MIYKNKAIKFVHGLYMFILFTDSVNGLCAIRGQSSNRSSATSKNIVTMTTTANNTCVSSASVVNNTSHIEITGLAEETLV